MNDSLVATPPEAAAANVSMLAANTDKTLREALTTSSASSCGQLATYLTGLLLPSSVTLA